MRKSTHNSHQFFDSAWVFLLKIMWVRSSWHCSSEIIGQRNLAGKMVTQSEWQYCEDIVSLCLQHILSSFTAFGSWPIVNSRILGFKQRGFVMRGTFTQWSFYTVTVFTHLHSGWQWPYPCLWWLGESRCRLCRSAPWEANLHNLKYPEHLPQVGQVSLSCWSCGPACSVYFVLRLAQKSRYVCIRYMKFSRAAMIS